MNANHKCVQIEALENAEPELLLNSRGLAVDSWGRIVPTSKGDVDWINFAAPKSARNLLVFCQAVVSCVRIGRWFLLQINNSSEFNAPERFQLARMLFGTKVNLSRKVERSILIKSDVEAAKLSMLVMVDLLFFFLMHEGHAHVVTSESAHGEYLGVQDGFIYFYSSDAERVNHIKSAMDRFMSEPVVAPEWVLDIVREDQAGAWG